MKALLLNKKLWLLLLLVMLVHAGILASFLFRSANDDSGVISQVIRGKVNADILVCGSSRALVHFDAARIGKRTGKTAFNMGMNGSQLSIQYPMLLAYLGANKKPDCIIQSLDVYSLEQTNELFNIGLYTPYLWNSALYEHFKLYSPEIAKMRYIPFYGVIKYGFVYSYQPDKNTPSLISDLAYERQQSNNVRVLGYEGQDLSWEQNNDMAAFKAAHPRGKAFRIDTGMVRLLENVATTCEREKIKLILVYPPELKEIQTQITNREEVLGVYRHLAEEHQLELWDFSQHWLTADQHYFYNSQHMNRCGASIFSDAIGDSLHRLLNGDGALAQQYPCQSSR